MAKQSPTTIPFYILYFTFYILHFIFIEQIKTILQHLAQAQLDEAWVLAEQVPERKLEKYDAYLPDNLLLMSYASQAFDTTATHQWLQQFIPPSTKPTKPKHLLSTQPNHLLFRPALCK